MNTNYYVTFQYPINVTLQKREAAKFGPQHVLPA